MCYITLQSCSCLLVKLTNISRSTVVQPHRERIRVEEERGEEAPKEEQSVEGEEVML